MCPFETFLDGISIFEIDSARSFPSEESHVKEVSCFDGDVGALRCDEREIAHDRKYGRTGSPYTLGEHGSPSAADALGQYGSTRTPNALDGN